MNMPITERPARADAACVSRLHWRLLGPSDLDRMQALHLRSLQGQGPDIVKPESRDFLARLLHGHGQVVAAFDGQALIAYGVLQHDLQGEEPTPAALTPPPAVPLLKLAGAAVDPAWRGLGLQRRLIAARQALAPMRAWLLSTAAPGNLPSWNNLLVQGFQVRALVQRYGGHARYLLLHTPHTAIARAPADGAGRVVNANDLAQQQQWLAEGLVGCQPGPQPGTLIYAPLATVAPHVLHPRPGLMDSAAC